MKNENFYKKLVILVKDKKDSVDIEEIANIIYFYIKQNYDVKIGDSWKEMMQTVKTVLLNDCKMEVKKVHALFIKLNNFTKYM